ncbi:probable E3 ubiquitin-protein ligase RNF217 [Coffea eugenioides]|uniref:probable E3 ubiquitin-protein ligase RNF217 n=1 Tax=Coffea eugenioides TaxID=49369 RepID=UPI000F612ADA|nr:probable E3 ubiquitin-protein ligase RNF217 [Coffea eugenioides]
MERSYTELKEENRRRRKGENAEKNVKAPTCQICARKIQKTRVFSGRDRCIENYIAAKVDGKVLNITCPQVGCMEQLDQFECEKIIAKKLFTRWCVLLCENAVTGLRKCYCPNPDCSELILDECCQENLRKSECPMCKKFFCFDCILPWNVCEEMHAKGSQEHENDILFEELVKAQRWTKCPGCHNHVERIKGCSFMRCRCHTGFCYKCGKQMQPVVSGVERCRCDN